MLGRKWKGFRPEISKNMNVFGFWISIYWFAITYNILIS